MTAASQTLHVEKGSTWTFAVAIVSSVVSPAWSVRGQVREDHDAAEVLHEWSTLAGNAVLGSAVVDGTTATTLTLTLTPAESLAWRWKRGVYDVHVYDPEGATAYRVLDGDVRVHPVVTR